MNRELFYVKAHAKRMGDSRYQRDDAIRLAHRAGFSLRAIAGAAGLSPTGVKKIVDRV